MTENYSKEIRELEKLLELFGKPENGAENRIETKCHLSGVLCPSIYKWTTPCEREDTGYRVVGAYNRFIINEKGENVARMGGRCGREILDLHGRSTGYFLTDLCRNIIAYQESLKTL